MDKINFNIKEFRKIYPEFSDIEKLKLQYFQNLAFLILKTSKIPNNFNNNQRENLLWLLICHLASLDKRGNTLVGSLSSASEGSVSSSFSLPQKMDNSWFNQSQYGATFKQIIQSYPQARYYC